MSSSLATLFHGIDVCAILLVATGQFQGENQKRLVEMCMDFGMRRTLRGSACGR